MTSSHRQPLRAHQRLKSATLELHQSLETMYPFSQFPHHMTPESSLDVLRLLVYWQESLEVEGHIVRSGELSSFDLCQKSMELEIDEKLAFESFGRVYVLIGSSLGGKVILKQAIDNNINLTSPLLGYYTALNKLHRFWPPLVKKLEQLISNNPSAFQYIHKGADAAYRQLLNQANSLASKKARLTKIAS